MKILSHADTSGAKDRIKSSSIKVCMHVLKGAQTDTRVMRAATALVAAGFEVSIVDVECGDNPSLAEDIHGIHMRHIIMSSSFASTRFTRRTLSRAAKMFIRSVFLLIRTPTDIYHSHDDATLPACYIAAQLRRKPLIFDAHELPLSGTSIRWRWLLALFKCLLTIILPHCAGVITVSSPIAQEIRERYHIPKVSIIRNVPPYHSISKSDRLRQYLGLSSDIRIALYQGGLQHNRGLDMLVQAAQFLEPKIVIVMMGQNTEEMQSELESLIALKGVHDRVKILPAVSYQELLNWTASADIGLHILPPDYSLSIRWCLTNKFFEYLMAGLPVLSSSLDVIAEAIKTHGVGKIVYSLTPVDIGNAINAMLADHSALAQMRHNALEIAHNEFNWEKESQQLIHLYQDILEGIIRKC